MPGGPGGSMRDGRVGDGGSRDMRRMGGKCGKHRLDCNHRRIMSH